jgi:MFS family permease
VSRDDQGIEPGCDVGRDAAAPGAFDLGYSFGLGRSASALEFAVLRHRPSLAAGFVRRAPYHPDARIDDREAAILPPVPSRFGSVLETIAPARLGRSFRWLLSSAVISNVGDGIALSAGPLLVASQTRDPLLVSFAVLAQVLPALLFGFVAGAVADRFDRRRIVVGVNLGRAAVLGVLAATIAGGIVNIAVVLAALFVLGSAETFADVGSSSLLPRLVARRDLGIANARLQSAFLLTNQLLSPPIGAFLFVVGMALPFAANAACFALGAVMVTRVVVTGTSEEARTSSLRQDMVEGFRWLLGHPPMRTLALTIVTFNVTFGAAWSVLVLYATQQLGMGAVGFGLLTTAIAFGGLIGAALYGRLERRFSLGNIMRVGLVIETLTHLSLALTREPVVALAVMVVFGAHASIWSTTSTAVRQRAVPDALLGRVTGVYTVAIFGGIVVGTPIGGLLARQFGITAPFWFGFVGSALLVTILWRQLLQIGASGAVDAPAGAR